MQPENPLLDVMNRTIYNLHFIEDEAKNEGPYEVTQLVNSFLGALAHPWEKFKIELETISLEEAQDKGWPLVKKIKMKMLIQLIWEIF